MQDLEVLNYKITWGSLPDSDSMHESLRYDLEKMYREISNPRKSTIQKLRRLIKKHPRNPQLKNYLTTAYHQLGEHDKAMEFNEKLLKAHPNYFFALVNKANHYETTKEFDKMADLMGVGFDLKILYPDREVFHISEFMIMQSLAVSYFTWTGDRKQADLRLKLMKDVEQDHPLVVKAESAMVQFKLDKLIKRLKEEEEAKIIPFYSSKPEQIDKIELSFNFTETEKIYSTEFIEDFTKIREYLSLDRDKLIEDLMQVLKSNYLGFSERFEEEDAETGFHAYNFLGELEAEEALPVILEMMRMDSDYYEQVFGDYMTQHGWIPLMKMSKNRPDLLESYLKLPGTYTYFRSLAIAALLQIALHYPEKMEEVKAVYKRLLEFFIESEIEDNVIDSDLIGFLVSDLISLRAKEFLPEIKKLHELGRVNTIIDGEYEDIKEEINSILPDSYAKREAKDVYELYEYYYNYDEPDPAAEEADRSLTPESESLSFFKKPGRNDPCPCGSGKKFKKCCLGKGIYD